MCLVYGCVDAYFVLLIVLVVGAPGVPRWGFATLLQVWLSCNESHCGDQYLR